MTREFLDKILLKLLGNKLGCLTTHFSNKFSNGHWPNISSYLRNRFESFSTYSETYLRIKYHIEEHPKCFYCGKPTQYGGMKLLKSNNTLYRKFCSTRCSNIYNIENVKETCKERYGTISVSQTKWFRKKVEDTCIQKYGCSCNLANEENKKKQKETCKKKYGHEYANQNEEIRKRINNTLMSKYGVKCGYNIKEIQDKMRSPESQDKRFRSLLKNHAFSKSNIEEYLYSILCDKFEDVKREYIDWNRYPYHCDFYVPSIDTFIELQGHWTHGGHPYDFNSIEDQNKVKEWKSKHTKYYDNAIRCWTISDVKKRETAKKNKINYIEIFSINKDEILEKNLY